MRHIIWCPTRGWKPEAWCDEVRDPQKYGPCYHCLYGARGQEKYLEHKRARVFGIVTKVLSS